MSWHIRKVKAGTRPSRPVTVALRALSVALLLLGVAAVKMQPASASLQVGSFSVSTNYFWPGAANGRQMSAGQSVRWRGYLTPQLSTARVTIQYKVGSTWYDGAWVRPSSSGYFDVAQRFNSPGYKTIRLRVYSGTASYNTWTGSPVNVTVYGWISLSALGSLTSLDPDGSGRCGFYHGQGRMATTDYSTVFWQDNDYCPGSSAAYDIRRKCTTFAGTIGVWSGESDTGGKSWFKVWGDGIALTTRQTSFGSNQVLSINISSYIRLSMSMFDSVGSDINSGIGNPRIRCSFSPT